MKKLKKGNRWGFEIKCQTCDSKLFRTQRQLNLRPQHFCRPCAASLASKAAAKVNKIHHQKEDFFSDNSLESFYWAGFIAADGCITDNGNALAIKLSEKDICQLEEFLKVTEATNNILNSGNEDRKRVVISNPTWTLNLKEKFNIGSVKSLTHEPPNTEDWTIDQIKAFIVGYADGDGTICYCGQDKYLKFGFIGTLKFLSWIKNFIVQEYQITLKDTAIQHKKNCPNKNVYELNIYCSKAKKVLSDLKQLPIYKLERKWSKV